MARKTLIEGSKVHFIADDELLTETEIQTGCLQRIAIATEKAAGNYVKMENDLAMYKRWYEEEKACSKKLYRSNAALRGVIKRMKNKG